MIPQSSVPKLPKVESYDILEPGRNSGKLSLLSELFTGNSCSFPFAVCLLRPEMDNPRLIINYPSPTCFPVRKNKKTCGLFLQRYKEEGTRDCVPLTARLGWEKRPQKRTGGWGDREQDDLRRPKGSAVWSQRHLIAPKATSPLVFWQIAPLAMLSPTGSAQTH